MDTFADIDLDVDLSLYTYENTITNASQPSVQQPSVQQPSVQQPSVQQPSVQQPSVQQPSVQQPSVQQPSVQQPSVQQPSVQQPSVQQPSVQQPSVQQPLPPINIINNTIKKRTIVNIDSSDRIQTSTNILDDATYFLPNNPIHTYSDSSTIEFTILGETAIQQGDSIVVQDVKGPQYNLMSCLQFIQDSRFVRILLNHHYTPQFDQYTTQYVTLSNAGTVRMSTYGNIPWTLINGKHKIYLTFNDVEQPTFEYFYIKLSIAFIPDAQTTPGQQVYTGAVTITINDINSIPLKCINANYPLINRIKGNHVVTYVGSNKTTNMTTIHIDCGINATIDGSHGGTGIRITKVLKTIPSNPLPNQYTISLSKTFNNVVKMEIIATEFPNCTKLLYDTPQSRKNNQFYWQILKHGNITYQSSMMAGHYTPASFMKAFSAVTGNIDIDLLIDIPTNLVLMRAYETIGFVSPFKFISSKSTTITVDTIVVTHANHMLVVGDTIEISEAIDSYNISKSIINGTHTISKVVDANEYEVSLPLYESIANDAKNNGGTGVKIRFPVAFRVLCKGDSIMGTLGFNNIGHEDAVTVFSKRITNQTPYKSEDDLDVSNDMCDEIISNKVFRPIFVMEQYILMYCNDIININHVGSTNRYFSKIHLLEQPGDVVFDGHLKYYLDFEKPVQRVSSLDLSFHYPDGSLYDFDRKNHSITFVITELSSLNDQQPSLDARTGGTWH